MRPFELGPNPIRRFYRGGPRIAGFRGLPADDEHAPEDWIASTTTVFGEDELGRTPGLAEQLAADPDAFFEPAHLHAYGPEPAVLLKLLDAGQRLPVHFHPDRAFAEAHLGIPHGKTEAWIVLEAEPDAQLHLGFARDVGGVGSTEPPESGGAGFAGAGAGTGELAQWVEAQDVEAMIDAMNPVPVAPGDAIFVPAGLAHVIGEGMLLLELQEPSDMSLLLEWKGVVDEDKAFLGLSPELALTAATTSPVDTAPLLSGRGDTMFPPEADRFFRADRIAGGTRLEPGFSVVIVTDGEGELADLPVRRGSIVLVPFGAAAVELTGPCRALRCRPPLP